MTLTFRRTISFIILLVMIMSSLSTSVFAADATAPTEAETVKPTEKPTEPPFTVETYGYQGYINKLEKLAYTKELGAVYSKKKTAFKLWSPVASSVKVNIYKTGSDQETGAQMLTSASMKYDKSTGVWSLSLDGDYKNFYYTYLVKIGNESHEVVDPYAKAVGVNGDRGMIIDLKETDPEGWADDTFARVSSLSQATVWEVSVRDFSASDTCGVSEDNRGKFLAFTEEGTTLYSKGEVATCVDYLKELGVSYVQLNPFYDFASIDETKKLDDQYNWGYDPKNYNVPEGSYSSNPYDGRVRIKECKEMIQALHNAGIGVVMDVVYNHTYYGEDSFFNRIVPNYFYRLNEDGSFSNGSGCGNDIATERSMMRDYIVKSVTYWAQEYHIDGFRFDLMGLMDVDTVNAIRDSLDSLKGGKNILMYGEAWNMETAAASDIKLANQKNMSSIYKRVAAFNDTARDAIKGSNFNAKEKGFVQQGSSKAGVRESIDKPSWARVPNQSVNYASCHDNLTLYDKLTASVYGDKKYSQRREDLVAMNKLSAAIVLTSRGMPFFLAGEEMGRTKEGDENSYKSSVEINAIDWRNLCKYTSLVEYYKGLLKIREAFSIFRDATGDHITTTHIRDDIGKETIAYLLESNDNNDKAVMIFNGSTEESSAVKLPEGDWVQLCDKDTAGLSPLSEASGSVTVAPTSAAVFVNKEAYDALSEKEEKQSTVYVQYVDTASKSVVFEQKLTGDSGESYTVEIPQSLLFTYNDLSEKSDKKGKFSENCSYKKIEVEAYEGDFSSVIFHFVDENGTELCNSLEITNRVDQPYTTPYIPKIEGFSLDLENLPKNGAGKFKKDPVEVYYKFKYTIAETVENIDPSLNCRANILYMGPDGEIFDIKSYMGTLDDPIEIDELGFEDFALKSVSDDEPVFSVAETNIILNYESTKKEPNFGILIAIGAFVVGIAFVLILTKLSGSKSSRKKRKMDSLSIDE